MKNTLYFFLLTGGLMLSFKTEKPKGDTSYYKYNRVDIMDFDVIDAYNLAIETTFLFGNYEAFVDDIGIPSKVTITKTDYPINSKADLRNVIAKAINPEIVTLHYKGIQMWYGYDNIIIPYTIDFRLTEKSVSYGDVKFDRSYSVEQFKGQFPKSSIASLQMPQSFFGMMTGQKGTNFQHFIVSRKSKDNPDAAPLIEFTFENGKLIFILFANF